jgi:hypothetical protein
MSLRTAWYADHAPGMGAEGVIVGGNVETLVIGGLIGKGGNAIASVDQTLTIWGLYHLTGETVAVNLGALDLGDFVVAADGSVTVSLVVTVNQTAAWSAAELIAMNDQYGEGTMLIQVNPGTGAVFVNVPCVVGQAYVSQGQRLRLTTMQDAKTRTGPALGMIRRVHEYAALLENTVEISFGTSLTPTPAGNMDPWDQIDPATGSAIDVTAGYSGVITGHPNDAPGYDGMLCWQIVRPYPATVCSVTSFLETAEPT